MTRATHLLAASALAAAALVADAPEARACDPLPSGVYGRDVLPPDGAAGVPRNARVLVSYDLEYYVPGETLSLRVQGGDVVDATVTETPGVPSARLITPAAALAPSTTYEVVDRLMSPCDDAGPATCEGEPAVVATFTTGTDLDTSPPRLTGVTADDVYECQPGNTCGPVDRIDIDVRIDGVEDDHDPAWVAYTYHDAAGAVIAGPTTIVYGRRQCEGDGDGTPSISSRSIVLPAQFTVRAVDLAGNAEASPHTFVTATCAGADEGTECDKDPGGGCAAGGGSSTSALAGLLAALLLVTRRRGAR